MTSAIRLSRLLALLGSCALMAQCLGMDGQGHRVQARGHGIINGSPTGYSAWQGVIGIYSESKGTVCTGTLVHRRVVITAGHCIRRLKLFGGFDYTQDPGPLRIYGGPDIRVWAGIKPVEYPRVDRAVVHPEWNGKAHSSDLGLLLLEEPMPASVHHLGLRRGPGPTTGEPVLLVGYGRTNDTEPGSDGRHHQARSSIVHVGQRWGEGPHTVIKIGGTPSAYCSGDSGGPALTRQDDTWVLAGVASMSDCMGDNINVNLTNHTGWIHATVCKLLGINLEGSSCPALEPAATPEQRDVDARAGDGPAAWDGGSPGADGNQLHEAAPESAAPGMPEDEARAARGCSFAI
jgi:hypothetical protein